MNELVIMKNQQAVTSSLQVAETFGKQHKDVLEAIKAKINTAENSALLNQMFSKGTYKASNGKTNPMYYMNRDGFSFIVMGFTGHKADSFKLEYISAFNQLEKAVKEQSKDSYMIEDPVKRAQRWIEERKAYDKAAVKADYFDKQMHNPGLLTATVIAKEYGKSAVWLNRYLEKLGVVYRQGKNWIIRQKYAGKGYMGYDNWSDESNKHVHPLLKWTQRGKKFIYDLLAQNGILPVIELMQVQQTDLLEGGY